MTAEFDGNNKSYKGFSYFILQLFIHMSIMVWLLVVAMALTFPLDENGKINAEEPQNFVAIPLFLVIEIGQLIFFWKKYYKVSKYR